MSSPDKDNIRCQYCGVETEFVTGEFIYPTRPDLRHLKFYKCPACHAYVGAHKKGNKPLGQVANAELRHMRVMTHYAFDPLYKTKVMSRSSSYKWLANKLGIKDKECHIAQFSLEQCHKVLSIMQEMKI